MNTKSVCLHSAWKSAFVVCGKHGEINVLKLENKYVISVKRLYKVDAYTKSD